ncbi:MAG TPA: CHAP domain-containing protein [Dissulfurispiraceae bacterium]|nr:CHAP domain-containing protein [Dissulfurispiraceae bacterium]
MTREQFRQAVLQNAIADIGKGEEDENNWGPYVEGLLNRVGIDYPASWCAAAVWSWISPTIDRTHIDQRAFNLLEIKTPSAKAMYNACRELGWLVTDPQPGDLIFFKRPGESWYAHVGIVEVVAYASNHTTSALVIRAIEGNKGQFPAKVRRYDYNTPIDNLLGYARLLNEVRV